MENGEEYCVDPPQDAIETKNMKERAFRIANLRRIREGLIETYRNETDPGLRLSLFEVIASLKNREMEILG